jgi:SAM-dependent methyltransferase
VSWAAIRSVLRHLAWHRPGYCNVCGRRTVFFCEDPQRLRETLKCLFCRSTARRRHVAQVLLETVAPAVRSLSGLSQISTARVYSADAGDAIAQALSGNAGFHSSEFLPGVATGTSLRERVTCQDLECLTFGDASFDIVITQDVLEHVRHPDRAIREIRRVLKPGGLHLFTVPFREDRPTETRVDTSGPEDVHLLPPEYHGDPIRGRILAYRTFGFDMFDWLRSFGFETTDRRTLEDHAPLGIHGNRVFVSVRTEHAG